MTDSERPQDCTVHKLDSETLDGKSGFLSWIMWDLIEDPISGTESN
jgi:hypothetical protein